MEDRQQLLEAGNTSNPPKGKWTDVQVGALVELVERKLKIQRPDYRGDVFERVRFHIAECLLVEESLVTLDAWFARDLGSE